MEDLLAKSMSFVTNNIYATSDQVPSELLDFWIIADEDLEKDNEAQWTVFMTGLIKMKSVQNKEEFKVGTEELMELFQDWQILLSTIHAFQSLGDIMKPVPVFDYEGIKNMVIEFEGS